MWTADINTRTQQISPRIKTIGILVAISLLAGIWLYMREQLITLPRDVAIRSAVTSQLDTLMNHFNGYIEQQQKRLNQLAAKASTVSRLTLDEQQRQAFETATVNEVEHAEEVKLIPAALTNAQQITNFVALDMARRTLNSQPTPPEAMTQNGKWHLLFASPLEDSNKSPTGTLLLTLSIDGIQQLLSAHSDKLGRIQLLQQIPNTQEKTVFAIGKGTLNAYADNLTSKTSHWELSFTPAQHFISQQQPPLLNRVLFYTLSFIEVVLTVGLLMILTASTRRSMVERARAKQNQGVEPSQQVRATEFMSEASNFAAIKQMLRAPQDNSDERSETPEEPHRPEIASDDDVFDKDDIETNATAEMRSQATEEFSDTVFRAYDIRGIYGQTITESFAQALGQALGTIALQNNQSKMVVGHDGRLSSPSLYESLIAGILDSGCDVYALGLAPTPLTNFAINYLEDTCSGITVTASHNPPEYNGFKMSIGGIPLTPDEIADLRTRMIEQDFAYGNGLRHGISISEAYIEHISNDTVSPQKLHVVLDGSNGAAGPLANEVLEQIGCQVSTLYCDVDGSFPNHLPDTSVAENLSDLISVVKARNADLGIALDGDGDRLVAVTGSGTIVWPDELMMIFARDVLARTPGADIVFDIKSTRRLGTLIGSYGGRPIMWKTGHSHIREKIRELNAPLGGEYSGHLFFNDRWFGFDDGIYSAVRLIEIINLREQSLDDMLSTLPHCKSSDEIRIDVPEEQKFELIDQLIANGDFKDAKLTTLDGLRIDFANSWGLVRASNTTPALTLRFEGNTAGDLAEAQSLIKQQLLAIAPDLDINF